MRQYLSLFKHGPAAPKAEMPHELRDLVGRRHVLENKNALTQIAALGGDFITVLHRTGEVLECSLFAQEFRGLRSADLLADGFLQRVHIMERPAFLGALSKAVHDNEKTSLELRLRCPSPSNTPDHFCWIEMVCTPDASFVAEQAGDQQILCIARDITRWKEREEELLALEANAHELVDSKTRFLTNISHALRTPLNAIIGFSDMMKLPGIVAQNEQQMTEYAGIINDSGRHLLGVVDEVLELSQFEAGHYRLDPKIFSVADLVAAALELIQFEAQEKGVRLVVADFDKALQMNADWRVAKQALVMVMAVQIKAAQKGKLHLTVGAVDGMIHFGFAGCENDDEKAACLLSGGSHLRGFIDLLSAELDAERSAAGRFETTLKFTTGLLPLETSNNIVSIEKGADCQSAPMKKSA